MNKELLSKSVEETETFWEWTKKNDKGNINRFPRTIFFAGEEYNQELVQNQDLQKKIALTIDFDKEVKKEDMQKIEEKIKENHDKLCFIHVKNINKNTNPDLEKNFLPYFDPSQEGASVVFIVTSSTQDMGKLSTPLTSRLDCINAKTAKPKQFFLDKYFSWVLVGSIFLIFSLGLLITFSWFVLGDEEKKSLIRN